MDAPDLGKMVGPLPLGGWAVVVAAGLGFAYYRRNSGGGGGVLTPVADVLDPTTYAGQTGGAVGLAAQPTDATATGYTSNDQWATAAIRYLVNNQVADGYTASQVVSKYLEGGALTSTEQGIIARAVAALGPTPERTPVGQVNIPGTGPGTTTPAGNGTAVNLLGQRYTRSGATNGWRPETWADIATRLRAAGFHAVNNQDLTVNWLTSRQLNKSLAQRYPGTIPAREIVYF